MDFAVWTAPLSKQRRRLLHPPFGGFDLVAGVALRTPKVVLVIVFAGGFLAGGLLNQQG